MYLDLTKAKVPAAWVGVVLLGAWEVYQYVENRYTHRPTFDDAMEQIATGALKLEAKIIERDLMSQSTRYAEIAKFYTDKLQSGEQLSAAEQERLDLVQRQQQRISDALKGE